MDGKRFRNDRGWNCRFNSKYENGRKDGFKIRDRDRKRNERRLKSKKKEMEKIGKIVLMRNIIEIDERILKRVGWEKSEDEERFRENGE